MGRFKMDKYEVIDMPGIGPKLLNENYFYGYAELFKPDKDVVVYSDSKDVGYLRGEKNSIHWKSYFGFWGTFNIGTGLTAAGQSAAAGAVGTVALPAALGWYLAEMGKKAGRVRAHNKIREKRRNGQIEAVGMDFDEFYKIVDDQDLIGKYNRYYEMADKRKSEHEGKPWYKKKFKFFEDEEMRDYRVNDIVPVIENLRELSVQSFQKSRSPVFESMEKEYDKTIKQLSTKKRTRNLELDTISRFEISKKEFRESENRDSDTEK